MAFEGLLERFRFDLAPKSGQAGAMLAPKMKNGGLKTMSKNVLLQIWSASLSNCTQGYAGRGGFPL